MKIRDAIRAMLAKPEELDERERLRKELARLLRECSTEKDRRELLLVGILTGVWDELDSSEEREDDQS